MKRTMKYALALLVALALLSNAIAADKPNTSGSSAQSWADSKPADMTKPVKVFIMLGQSNMLGMGNISRGGVCPLEVAVKKEKLYRFLLDEAGNWAERKDVRNVSIMQEDDRTLILHNEWLRVGAAVNHGKMAAKMGTEYGIGHVLGNALEEWPEQDQVQERLEQPDDDPDRVAQGQEHRAFEDQPGIAYDFHFDGSPRPRFRAANGRSCAGTRRPGWVG